MPAVTSGRILVTGANGYIATWLVKDLLEQGFSVRGTVRSEAKGEHLKKLFASYGEKFELAIVDDITKDGAFDEAVKGIDAIQHTASPCHWKSEDPQDVIHPAVAGTLSILQSTLKYGTQVRRLVVLSSTAAIQTIGLPHPKVFTESDWNDASVAEVETKGKDAAPFHAYLASKTLAERAAWAWYERNKPELKWDLVVLNPCFVFGPLLHGIRDVKQLNTSMAMFYDFVLKGEADLETLANEPGNCWIDVRDVSKASVLALLKEGASGERIIISSGTFTWQDWVNTTRKFTDTIPAGNTTYKVSEKTYTIVMNPAKSMGVLGIRYRTIEETAKDILDDFEQKGWWPSVKP